MEYTTISNRDATKHFCKGNISKSFCLPKIQNTAYWGCTLGSATTDFRAPKAYSLKNHWACSNLKVISNTAWHFLPNGWRLSITSTMRMRKTVRSSRMGKEKGEVWPMGPNYSIAYTVGRTGNRQIGRKSSTQTLGIKKEGDLFSEKAQLILILLILCIYLGLVNWRCGG